MGRIDSCFSAEFLRNGPCKDVYRTADRTVCEHRTADSFLKLDGVGRISKAHPVVPEHIAGGEAADGNPVQKDCDVFLTEAADVESGITVAAGFRGCIESGNSFEKFGIRTSGST